MSWNKGNNRNNMHGATIKNNQALLYTNLKNVNTITVLIIIIIIIIIINP